MTSLACAALGFTVGSPAAHAAGNTADDTTSWTVRTALSQYGSDRSLFSYTVEPGDTISDGLVIANQGKSPITLKLYAADGFTSDTGGFDIVTEDEASKAVGTWLTPSTASVTIPGRQEIQVPFTLTVPDDATPGDHMGGIVTVFDQGGGSEEGDTVIHRRVGLRVKVRVSGALTPQLEVEDTKVDFDGGSNPFGTGDATLTYTVHNAGNTVLGGIQTAKVSAGLGGTTKSVELDDLPDLLPGESWDASVPIKDVHAMLWVSGGVTVTPVLTDAAGSTSTLEPITEVARVTVSAWSWVILIGTIVVLALAVWLVIVAIRRWRSTSKAKVEAQVDAQVEAKVAAALREKESQL